MMRYMINDVVINVPVNAQNIPKVVCIFRAEPEWYMLGFKWSVDIFTTFAMAAPVSIMSGYLTGRSGN